MGMIQQVLCSFLGQLIAVTSFRYDTPMFTQEFERFFEKDPFFPFERNFDVFPFDVFDTWTPDLHMLEFPLTMNVPRIQVSCDQSNLTLLVDKKSFGLILTKDEIQLGNGCYSNKELANQFVFDYNLDQCGTTSMLQNGLQAFTNSLHLTLKKPAPTWWQSPPSVHIYCIPKRLKEIDFISTPALSFNIQAMDSFWNSLAESNLYERGTMINLQVSANILPNQQLFVLSCFVSASPEPHTRPRNAVIFNKGCSSGSPHPVAQFVASDRADVVNIMLNTTNLIPELYVHCNLVVSDTGVTLVSKSCNYDVKQSRWKDLSGAVEVCSCCSSKCKGQSMKSLPEDVKGLVRIGPLVIVEHVETNARPELEHTSSTSPPNTEESFTPKSEDEIVGSSVFSKLPASPQGAIIIRQDPTARLTLWLPGQLNNEMSNEVSPSQGLSSEVSNLPDSNLSNFPNEISHTSNDYKDDSLLEMNLLPEADWPNWFPDLTEELQGKSRLVRSEEADATNVQTVPNTPTEISVNLMLVKKPKQISLASETSPESDKWMPAEMDLGDMEPADFDSLREKESDMQTDETTTAEDLDIQPVIRSKLEFSKSVDGSQKLTYEEVKRDGKVLRRCEKSKLQTRTKGLHSTFLYLLRKMNKAE